MPKRHVKAKPQSAPTPVVDRCTYRFEETDRDGNREVMTCRAARACKICNQCSKLKDNRELGHCTGHVGLRDHIDWPKRGQLQAGA